MDRSRRSRGYLPHIDGSGLTQFVTWHLADALPAPVVEKLRIGADALPEGERKAELNRRIESYSDAGHGECLLRDPRVARICQEKLFEYDGDLYHLHAWVVMPNHVHVLLSPEPHFGLKEILHRLKGSSAREINQLLGREGRVWQPDFFDVWIRSGKHFEGVRRYIEWNPVKAKQVADPVLCPWSSANGDSYKRLEVLRSARPGLDRPL